MYWRVTGLSQASPVDSILDKDNYTLEELLDEDELIQECKSLNNRLIIFLKQRSSVEALLRFLVEVPDEEEDDPKRRFKYPFAACEVFCCEVEGIFQTLLEDEVLMDLLFSLLASPPPLNCMLAGYFSRVVGCLLARHVEEVGAYLQAHPATLNALCAHCGTTSVAEVVVRLVGAGEVGGGGAPPPPALDWLGESQLLPLLLRALGPEAPPDAAANVAEILAAVAQSPGSPLVAPLAEPEVLARLVSGALSSGTPGAASHALDVCLALLEPVAGGLAHAGAAAAEPVAHAMHAVPIPAPRPVEAEGGRAQAAAAAHATLRAGAIACLSRDVGRLVGMLEVGDGDAAGTGLPGGPWLASYGMLGRPVGHVRLKAVELLASLLHTGDSGAEEAVMATEGVQRAMALVLRYPFNNALHHAATRLLTSFEVGSPALVRHLLGPCGLLRWLLDAPREVRPAPAPADAPAPDAAKRPAPRPLRAGYAGHLTHLANRLVATAEEEGGALVREALRASPEWEAFVRDQLEPRNALESVFAWQCGRPTMHGGDSYQHDAYQRYGVFEGDMEGGEEEEDLDVVAASALATVSGGNGAGPSLGPVWGTGPGSAGPGVTPFHSFVDNSSSSDESSDDASGSDSDGNSPRGPVNDLAASVVVGSVRSASDGADMADMSDDAVLQDVEVAEQLVHLRADFEGALHLRDAPGEGGAEGDGEEARRGTDDAGREAEYDAFLFWKTELPGVGPGEGGSPEPGPQAGDAGAEGAAEDGAGDGARNGTEVGAAEGAAQGASPVQDGGDAKGA
ncbi:hypothetical protein ACKKBG_A35495 [Auxenochlorella protothecoides x Auxenochlorella symbiontica]